MIQEHETETTADYCINKMHKAFAIRSAFERVFQVRFSPFWSNLTGFDVVKFDDEVIKSGDGCMRDVVREQYGEEGVSILLRLIHV